MASLPTGTITFLFTDIEGSTKLAQVHSAEWEAARERHPAILSEAADALYQRMIDVLDAEAKSALQQCAMTAERDGR